LIVNKPAVFASNTQKSAATKKLFEQKRRFCYPNIENYRE